MKKHSCTNFKNFMNAQLVALKKAIEDDKYFMSKKAGEDVGFKKAEKDFSNNYLCDWAQKFKDDYCSNCPDQEGCNGKELQFNGF